MTALIGAAAVGATSILLALMKAGANVRESSNVGVTAITAAAIMGHIPAVEVLSEVSEIDQADSLNRTALHYAAMNNATILMQVILESCPDSIDLQDNLNMTALDISMAHEDQRTVDVLLAYMASKCKRFGLEYNVGDIITQNCKALQCHCTGRWRLTDRKVARCNHPKDIVLISQKNIEE